MTPKKYTCFCCGYDQLECRPYKNSPDLVIDTKSLRPPYKQYWGEGSYDVCDCCGFEFGNDDDDWGEEKEADSFEDYRKRWIQEEDCKWFEPDKKPQKWSLETQLKNLHSDSL